MVHSLSHRIAEESGISTDSALFGVPTIHTRHPHSGVIPVFSDGEVSGVPGVDVLVAEGKVNPSSYRGRLWGLMHGLVAVGEAELAQRLKLLDYLLERGQSVTPSRLLVPVNTHPHGNELCVETAIIQNIEEFAARVKEVMTRKEWSEANFLWTPYCGSPAGDVIKELLTFSKFYPSLIGRPWINPVDGNMARTMNAKIWAKELRAEGFNFPRTELLNDDFQNIEELFFSVASDNDHPTVILKPNLGASGMNQFIARSPDELKEIIWKNGLKPSEYVVQDFIKGLIASPSVSGNIDPTTGHIDIYGGTNQIFNPDAKMEHVGNNSFKALLKFFPEIEAELRKLAQYAYEKGYTGNFGADIFLHSDDPHVMDEWKNLIALNIDEIEFESFIARNIEKISWTFGEMNMRYLGASRGPLREAHTASRLIAAGVNPEGRVWQIKKIKKKYGFDECLRRLQRAGLDWNLETQMGVLITNFDELPDGSTLFHYDIHTDCVHKRWEMEQMIATI